MNWIFCSRAPTHINGNFTLNFALTAQRWIENNKRGQKQHRLWVVLPFCENHFFNSFKTNVNRPTKPLYVILSGENRGAVFVVEVFVRERAACGDDPSKNRGANATKGYGLEFWWLLNRCNIPLAIHRESLRDPASANASRFRLAPRSAEVRLRSG